MQNSLTREHTVRACGLRMPFVIFAVGLVLLLSSGLAAKPAFAGTVSLQSLIDEALLKSPEVLAAEARANASKYRIPVAGSFPDPMFTFGYQNEGFSGYTLGTMQGAQWMFGASQMLPFPGKLPLKEEMAGRDHEGTMSAYSLARHKTVSRIRELYYELLVAHRSLGLIGERSALYSRIEDAAAARYSSGMGTQSDILMAQTEKYMLREKEEMLKQKVRSTEAMLAAVLGRDSTSDLGIPEETASPDIALTLDMLVSSAYSHSPELRTKEAMLAAAEAKVSMAKREYYPDFTVNAGYFKRKGEFEDMWSLTATVNIPIFYKSKQRQGVLEAEAQLAEAKQELQAARLMAASAVRDSYSMYRTAGELMELYRTGLIPKTYQDLESALAAYSAGKYEIMSVISKLRGLIDVELLYWTQFGEREKAAARIGALTAEVFLRTEARLNSPGSGQQTGGVK